MNDLCLLDLPSELLSAIVVRAPWTARAACRTLRTLRDAACTSLHLRVYNVPVKQRHKAEALLAHLPQLTELEFHGDSLDIEPLEDAAALTSLTVFGSSKIKGIEELSSCPAQLVSLTLKSLSSLNNIQPLAELSSSSCLAALRLTGCSQVKDFSPIAVLIALTSLDLSTCGLMSSLPRLTCATRLVSVNLSGCVSLIDVSSLASASALVDLDLSGCYTLTDISPLAGCARVTALNLSSCRCMSNVDALQSCTDLQRLRLRGCPLLDAISALASCSRLVSLDLLACGILADISALAECALLEDVSLARTRVRDVAPLAACPRLTVLDLEGCARVIPQGLAACSQLTSVQLHVEGSGPVVVEKLAQGLRPVLGAQLVSLALSGCYDDGITHRRQAGVELSAALRGCTNLTRLVLGVDSPNVVAEFVASCHALRVLDLAGCLSIRCIKGLESCSQLQTLSLTCYLITNDLTPLGQLPSLTSLSCGRCVGIDLSHLAPILPHLTSLHLDQYSPISAASASALSVCVNLTTLQMCGNGLELEMLRGCCRLRDLNFDHIEERTCTRMLDLTPLSNCTALEKLSVQYWAVGDLSPLASCRLLDEFHACRCSFSNGIGGLAACRRLRCVDLGCSNTTIGQAKATCPWLKWDKLTAARD